MKDENSEKAKGYLLLLIKASIVVFIGVVLAKLINYAYKILIARTFGPEIYGILSLATMILSLFTGFATLGLAEGTVRYVAIYRGKKQYSKIASLLKKISQISLFSSVIAGITLFFTAEFLAGQIFHNLDAAIFLKWLSFSVPLIVIGNIYLATIRAFEKVKEYSFLSNVLQGFLRILFILIAIGLGWEAINSVIFSQLAALIIFFAVAYWFFKRIIPKKITQNQKSNALSEVISYSWPLMFAGMAYSLSFTIDSMMVGYYMDSAKVGLYNAAITILSLLSIAPELFLQMFFPLIVKEYSRKNIEVIKQLTKQVTKWAFIINFPLFLIILVFPGAVINFFFGEKFLEAAPALSILIVGMMIGSAASTLNSLLSMKGKSRIILINFIAIFVINLVLNFFFIPLFGIEGAALATLISWIIFTAILIWQVYRYFNFVPFRRKMFKIAVVSLLPFLALLIIKNLIPATMTNIILMIVFFGLIYCALIILTKCLDNYDLEIIEIAKKKIYSLSRL